MVNLMNALGRGQDLGRRKVQARRHVEQERKAKDTAGQERKATDTAGQEPKRTANGKRDGKS